jgi:hypothetical protein
MTDTSTPGPTVAPIDNMIVAFDPADVVFLEAAEDPAAEVGTSETPPSEQADQEGR